MGRDFTVSRFYRSQFRPSEAHSAHAVSSYPKTHHHNPSCLPSQRVCEASRTWEKDGQTQPTTPGRQDCHGILSHLFVLTFPCHSSFLASIFARQYFLRIAPFYCFTVFSANSREGDYAFLAEARAGARPQLSALFLPHPTQSCPFLRTTLYLCYA